MISKSTKAKRRAQAARAKAYLLALMREVPAGAGAGRTCAVLNEQRGIALLPEFARVAAQYHKTPDLWPVDADVVAALGHQNPLSILRDAGLI